MNSLYNVQAFVDRDTRVEVRRDPLVLKIVLGESEVILFLAMTGPSKADLESGIAFLDTLIERAVSARSSMFAELARVSAEEAVRS